MGADVSGLSYDDVVSRRVPSSAEGEAVHDSTMFTEASRLPELIT